MMPPDTSRTIEIHGSPLKILMLVAVSLVFVALGAAIAFGYLPGPYADGSFCSTAGFAWRFSAFAS